MTARIDARLASFAARHASGMKPREAALAAGFAVSTVDSKLASIEDRARAAGLLVDPAVIQDAIAIIEEGLPELAREIVRCGKGEAPRHDSQLDFIREAFDRARGKAKSVNEHTGKQGGPIETVTRVTIDLSGDASGNDDDE